MNKIWKRVIIIIAVLLIIITAAGLFAGNYFYRLALDPSSDKSAVFGAPHNEFSTAKETEDGKDNTASSEPNQDWLTSIGCEDVYIQSYDSLTLHSYLVQNNASNRWVILAHGYTGTASQMAKSAKRFYDMGYSVLLPDARGHGDSEGSYIGMGWHERKDIAGWVDKLIDDNSPAIEIVLYGVSMGGATVMMTAGENLPGNVKAIIEDCGYTSVKEEFAYQLKEIFGLPSFPVMNFASIVTYFKAGYTLGEANSIKQLRKTQIPMLFIHGDADTFVPSYMVKEAYDACSSEKELYIVEGAGHGEASRIAGDGYWDKIEAFLSKYVS